MPKIKSKDRLSGSADAGRMRRARYDGRLESRVQDMMDLLDRAETETLWPEYRTSERTAGLALRLAENLTWHREIGALFKRYQEIGEAYRVADPEHQSVLRPALDQAKQDYDQRRQDWRAFVSARAREGKKTED